MNVSNSYVNQLIEANEEFSFDDIKYLMYEIENKEDLLILNYIKDKITKNYGKKFLEHSRDKIEFVLQLLIDDEPDKLYEFYQGTYGEYMKLCNYTFEAITSFNLIFLTYIHIALKVIREYS